MSVSQTDIANMALMHLGSSKEISELDTENSREARAIRRFYNTALEATLRASFWPFARKIQAMQLVASDPNIDWAYAYRYPVNCVMFKRILSGSKRDNHSTQVPFLLGSDNDGPLVWTDLPTAYCEYTQRIEQTSFYQSDFVLMLSYQIARLVAPFITAGDPFGLGTKAYQLFEIEKAKANNAANNEEKNGPEADSELLASRNS